MAIKVGINGYGRIGRNVLRALYEGKRTGQLEIVALNDLCDSKTNAHLTRYDTVHGRFAGEVKVDGDYMVVNGDRIRVFAERDPAKLPCGEDGVEYVLECTGLFRIEANAAAGGLVLTELKCKLDGFAVRVPNINGSLVDLTFTDKRASSVEEVNQALRQASAGALQGILAYNDAPLVSVDFNHDAHSSVFDATLTKVIEGTLVKVCAWYDNEWGFSSRMIDTTLAWSRAS